jgi:membrane-associated phospholipid phosphatase
MGSRLERDVAREVGLVGLALLVYFGIRNRTAGGAGDAFANGEDLLHLEGALGMAWEKGLQSAILSIDPLVTLANWVYIWGHWPVILLTGVALFSFRRDRYYLLRNAMFVSGAIGFLFYAFLPVAPPRLLDLGLVDTVTEYSNAYRALQPPGLTNQYAAFPSLHAGWNLLVGIVLLGSSSHLLVRSFAVASPLAMGFAVVVTANHFVLDVVAGTVVVLFGLWVAKRLSRRSAATLAAGGTSDDRTPGAAAPPPFSRRAPCGQQRRRAPRRRGVRAPVRRG